MYFLLEHPAFSRCISDRKKGDVDCHTSLPDNSCCMLQATSVRYPFLYGSIFNGCYTQRFGDMPRQQEESPRIFPKGPKLPNAAISTDNYSPEN